MNGAGGSVGRAALAAGLVALLAAGCARRPVPAAAPLVPPSDAEPLTVTEQDAGQAIELEPGQQLIVRLEANRSTGYGWALGAGSGDVLMIEGAAGYEVSDAGNLGGGGTEVWRLRAIAPGQRDLRFEYRRPFEPGIPPVLRVSYAVTVH